MKRKIRVTALLAVLITVTAFCSFVAYGQGLALNEEVSVIIEQMSKKSIHEVWRYEADLIQLGPDAKDAIKGLIGAADPQVQVVLAHRLFQLEEASRARRTLVSIIANKDVDGDVRTAAVGVLEIQESKRNAESVEEVYDKILEPRVKVAVCRFLFKKLKNIKYKNELKRLIKLDDFETRARAAIALGSLEDYESARETLKEVAKLPTEAGQVARAMLQAERYLKEAEKAFGLGEKELIKLKDKEIRELKMENERLRFRLRGKGTGIKLIDEILKKISLYYVEDKTSGEDRKLLIDQAAKGIASSLDKHSSYYDEKETREFLERTDQHYSGIGAVVTKAHKNDLVTIDRPIYSGPAYQAGLRYGDQIVTVQDNTTIGKELTDVVSEMKGLPETQVKLGVYRRGSATVHHIEIDSKIDETLKKILNVNKGTLVLARLFHSSWSKQLDVKLEADKLKLRDMTTEGFYWTNIGAYVNKANKFDVVTVVSAVRGGAAYQAGIRDGDMISKINGVEVYPMEVSEAVSRLREKPGTPINLTVFRAGENKVEAFTMGDKNSVDDVNEFLKNKIGAQAIITIYPPEPEYVKITRRDISMPSVLARMLPSNIGYVKLEHFGEHSASEMKAALEALKNKGMKVLIFDLRGNPGGLLSTAVNVADLFIHGKKLIVFDKGNNPIIAPRRDHFSTNERTVLKEMPVLVLVNNGSASASEIVSGCLQDHKRATIIGETTYGKGSVQQLMPMISTDNKSRLRITIAKYYLPNGRSIHEVGVHPDIEIAQPEIPGWQFEEIQKLRDHNVAMKYLDKRYGKNKDLFIKLAENDHADPSKYPDFEEWYESLNTKAEKDYVRWLLRNEVRRRVADEKGRQMMADYVDDTQLQRAVQWCAEKMEKKLDEMDDYKFFADKFKD